MLWTAPQVAQWVIDAGWPTAGRQDAVVHAMITSGCDDQHQVPRTGEIKLMMDRVPDPGRQDVTELTGRQHVGHERYSGLSCASSTSFL